MTSGYYLFFAGCIGSGLKRNHLTRKLPNVKVIKPSHKSQTIFLYIRKYLLKTTHASHFSPSSNLFCTVSLESTRDTRHSPHLSQFIPIIWVTSRFRRKRAHFSIYKPMKILNCSNLAFLSQNGNTSFSQATKYLQSWTENVFRKV